MQEILDKTSTSRVTYYLWANHVGFTRTRITQSIVDLTSKVAQQFGVRAGIVDTSMMMLELLSQPIVIEARKGVGGMRKSVFGLIFTLFLLLLAPSMAYGATIIYIDSAVSGGRRLKLGGCLPQVAGCPGSCYLRHSISRMT